MGGFTLGSKTTDTPKPRDLLVKSKKLDPRNLHYGLGQGMKK